MKLKASHFNQEYDQRPQPDLRHSNYPFRYPLLIFANNHERMRSKKSIIITPPILLLLTITPFVHPDKFCGTSLEDAQSTCWQPCGTDSDCCSLSQKCYETEESCGSSIYEGTQHNYCGISWCDAAYTCTTPCEDNVCPEGMGCYSNTPCGGSSSVVVELPPDPVESDSSYCGHSLEDAKMTCWQPCPRGDSDCCLGLKCFDTANTNIDDIDGGSSNSSSSSTSSGLGQCGVANYEGANHYYCGKSWCDAAYTCGEPCPGTLMAVSIFVCPFLSCICTTYMYLYVLVTEYTIDCLHFHSFRRITRRMHRWKLLLCRRTVHHLTECSGRIVGSSPYTFW